MALQDVVKLVLDGEKPLSGRADALYQLVTHDDESIGRKACAELLKRIRSETSTEEAEQMRNLQEAYGQLMSELKKGPIRPATYIGPSGFASLEIPGYARVHVITPDGQERYPFLAEGIDQTKLEPGMNVLLDPQGVVVVAYEAAMPVVGDEALFLRPLEGNGDVVEVSYEEKKHIFYTSEQVRKLLAAGEVRVGDHLLICPRRMFAYTHVPVSRKRNYRFVDESNIAEVSIERDVGNPHPVLDRLLRHARLLLFRPEILAEYGKRPKFSALLTGPTGTGKTFHIKAFLWEFQQMLRTRVGRPAVGSRVIRVKLSELLSEWLGRSDKNMDALFDDIVTLAREEEETATGEKLRLPVVVILEEGEGLSRRRGEYDGSGGVYDRIMTTMLQRLDDPIDDLRSLPIIWITTTNRPDIIDAAMWRRLGGDVQARFGRLDRDGTAAVLAKKLRDEFPYEGRSKDKARSEIVRDVVEWLFDGSEANAGQVEVVGQDGRKVICHRRDFMTPSVLDNAVAGAIDRLVAIAEASDDKPTLSSAEIIAVIDNQLETMLENMTAQNVRDYVDLPDQMRPTLVRRVSRVSTPAPAALPVAVS